MSEDFGHELAPGTLDSDIANESETERERWRDDHWDHVEQVGAQPDDEDMDDQLDNVEWQPPEEEVEF